MGDEPRGADVPIIDVHGHDDDPPPKVDPQPHLTGRDDENPRPKGK